MNRKDFINNYWQYYLLLEAKFINSLTYVDLNENNYLAYSNEFAYELISIGSELDVFMKVVSDYSQDDRKNINDYAKVILTKFPTLISQEVLINYKDLKIKPFENWSISAPSQSLFWWDNYNSVKHGRFFNFNKATLKSVLYSLASLFVLEMYNLRHIANVNQGEPDIPDNNQQSKLFTLLNWKPKAISMNNIMAFIQ